MAMKARAAVAAIHPSRRPVGYHSRPAGRLAPEERQVGEPPSGEGDVGAEGQTHEGRDHHGEGKAARRRCSQRDLVVPAEADDQDRQRRQEIEQDRERRRLQEHPEQECRDEPRADTDADVLYHEFRCPTAA